MTNGLKISLLLMLGLITGSTIWLWLNFGADVFMRYAQGIAMWCF